MNCCILISINAKKNQIIIDVRTISLTMKPTIAHFQTVQTQWAYDPGNQDLNDQDRLPGSHDPGNQDRTFQDRDRYFDFMSRSWEDRPILVGQDLGPIMHLIRPYFRIMDIIIVMWILIDSSNK